MVVHPAYANWSGTLVNGLMHYTQQNLSKKDEESLRPGIVHRLDKDTSGLLVVAKTDEAHKHLARQFADKETRRTYQALVWGDPPESGTMRGDIGMLAKDRKEINIFT